MRSAATPRRMRRCPIVGSGSRSCVKTRRNAANAICTGGASATGTREFGFPIGVGARTALKRIPALLEDATIALPELVRQTVWVVLQETRELEARIATIDQQLAWVVREHAVARRLVQIPGVGVITATALIGAVGHIHAFRRGRHFASWLGLTPRESSSGGRRRLGGISKRGDVYLRCLLTH